MWLGLRTNSTLPKLLLDPSYVVDLIQDIGCISGHFIGLGDYPELSMFPNIANNMDYELDGFCGYQLLC